MLKYLRNNLIIIIITIILIALGVFCILVDGEDVIQVFSYLAAGYLIIIGGWMIYAAFRYKDQLNYSRHIINRYLGYLLQGILLIGFAVLVILFPGYLIRIIIGICLILLPTYTLIIEENKKQYFLRNLWKYIIGIIFVLAIDVVMEILFIIIGIVLFLIAIYFIYLLVINYRDKDYPNVITKYFIAYILKRSDKE